MKISIKVLLVGIALVCVSFSVTAQKKWQIEKADTESKALCTALELDEGTSAKISEVYLDFLVKQKQMNSDFKERENKGEDIADERKLTMKNHNKARVEKIETIIGPDLKDKYRLFRKQLREIKQAKKNN